MIRAGLVAVSFYYFPTTDCAYFCVGQCHIPEELKIRDFVCKPPAGNTRLYCTMIRRDEDGSCSSSGEIDPVSVGNGYSTTCGVAFTLYLEYLGGLIPLLKVSSASVINEDK